MASAATKCLFCNIAQGLDAKTTLLFQDETIVAFRDIRPAAKHHYLICPKQHISSSKELTKDQIPLVEALVSAGKRVLEEQGGDVNDVRFGFHYPFVMISHLHLHVISPVSEMGFFGRLLFRPNSYWFVTADWLLEKLRNS